MIKHLSLILIMWDRDQNGSYLYVFLTATVQTSLSLSFFFAWDSHCFLSRLFGFPEPSAPFSSQDIGWFQWSEAEIDAETGRLLFKS